MGLFKKKKSPEELAFLEQNRERLESFQVTKALGVKKYPTATQFIYDKENRCCVVVDGPVETFRERNPYVIDFDQIQEVILEIDEYWSDTANQYEPRGPQRITNDDYDKVYWRYDFYITLKTTHPYAKDIRFQTNYKPTIMKIENKSFIFVRRGFEIGGTYKSKELPALIERMEQLYADEEKQIHRGRVVDTLTGERPDGVLNKLLEDGKDDWYLKKIDVMTTHIKRANVIAKLVL